MDQPEIAMPQMRPFAHFSVQVAEAQVVGGVTHGTRRVIPILGGVAQGEDWSGKVLPGGADFQLIVHPGYAELDARYVIELDSGDLLFVKNHAVRSGPPELMQRLARGEPVDPAQIYFRCLPRFETASPALRWINERLFVGGGARHPDKVVMRFFELY